MPIPAFVFAKPPLPGVSKTRLAAGVGNEAAAALAAAFIEDVWALLGRCDGVFGVMATTDPGYDYGLGAIPTVEQGRGDLGTRLERVLRQGIAEHGAAIAIGADSPGLPLALLTRCVAALEQHDAGFVPSEDGGFAVWATSALPAGTLDAVPWSHPETLDALTAALADRGLSSHRTEVWFDVDEPRDLERFRTRVPPETAPATWTVLSKLHANRVRNG